MRRVERVLLLVVGVYLAVGLAVLHGAGFLEGLRVPLVVGGTTVTALLALHRYWSRSDFRGDITLFPAVALLAATGLIFLMRLDLEYGLRQFVWLLTGLAVLAVTTGLLRDYRLLAEYQYFWAAAGAAALLA
ncbi:MAG: FtsW/RodA/SpoVE family cell cycle protein, partial [Desulfotomaculales bacterium]